MDFRTPCQILLGLLLSSLSLAALGLIADNVSYVNEHQSPSPVTIHYTRWNATAEAQYSYWVAVDYLPSRFDMGRTYAMLVASIVCVFVGAGVAAASWRMRSKKTGESEVEASQQQRRSLPLPWITLILAAVAFSLTLAVAIYAWQPVMRFPINFLNSLPISSNVSGVETDGPIVYQSPFGFTPEVWNCLLGPYVTHSTQREKIQGLCREATVVKDLTIPMVVLSAVLLCSSLWTWRQARLVAASGSKDMRVKEVEEISIQGKE